MVSMAVLKRTAIMAILIKILKECFQSGLSTSLLRQAKCAVHFPEVLPWALWCYGLHPVRWHPLGIISSETGVQQGDPPGPLLFSLVIHRVVSAIASNCPALLFHMWYLDDGTMAGPKLAVLGALSIVQHLGPPNGLFINTSKCELYIFPSEMKSSKELNFEILGAPIGDFVFCAKYASQKHTKAQGLLHMLEDVGSMDPQVALLRLRQCGSFCKMVHLARSTPPSLMADALQMFDNDIHHAFAECTAVDAFGNSWQQAQLSLSRGGLGLCSLSHHSSAAYISSVSASE